MALLLIYYDVFDGAYGSRNLELLRKWRLTERMVHLVYTMKVVLSKAKERGFFVPLSDYFLVL